MKVINYTALKKKIEDSIYKQKAAEKPQTQFQKHQIRIFLLIVEV